MRGFGFRIAALTSILVVFSVATLGVAAFVFLDRALEHRAKRHIENEMHLLLSRADPSDPHVLIAETSRLTASGVYRRFAYRIVAGDGTHVAGDVWIQARTTSGWFKQRVEPAPDRPAGDGSILVLTSALGPGFLLSVAGDTHWIADVEDELLRTLGWAILGVAALAALTAFIANRLVARRIDLVAATARAIMDGDLKSRVPTAGTNDDFDRLSQTLNTMLDRIQGLMDNLEQVTNDIAHDLRTPLSRLVQGLEQTRLKTASITEYEDAINRARTEAEGLLAIFTALLRIAQIEAGARRSAFREIDLSELVRSICEAYEPSVEEGGRRISTAIADGVRIRGDRDLLAQMLANLIENALTHTPDGSSVSIALGRVGAGVELSVADDGLGVPEEERAKIFRRFYRCDAARSSPGTGLGLSLVAAVAKLHGAVVLADDNRPGLRVSVTFSGHATA